MLNVCRSHNDVIKRKPVPRYSPLVRETTGHRSFDVFSDLGLNERLSKQSWGWWFETPSRPLWRHSNDVHHNTWLGIIVCCNLDPGMSSFAFEAALAMLLCSWPDCFTFTKLGMVVFCPFGVFRVYIRIVLPSLLTVLDVSKYSTRISIGISRKHNLF